ncbi:hypothetical protein ACFL04_00605 [Patescibacteria group bacterium]
MAKQKTETTDVRPQHKVYSMPDRFMPKESGGGNSFLTIILILVVIALIAGGAIFYFMRTPANENTNTLPNTNGIDLTNSISNTNTAQELNLAEHQIVNDGSTINIPDNWQITANVQDDVILTVASTQQDTTSDGNSIAALITVARRTVETNTISAFVNEFLVEQERRFPDLEVITQNTVTVAGREAIVADYTYSSLQTKLQVRTLYIIIGQTAYLVNFTAIEEQWQKYDQDATKILTSIRPAAQQTTNINTNANSNNNTNSSVNTNNNTNSNVTPIPLTNDDDLDGLTLDEETLYGTDPQARDTDADGFIDGYSLSSAGVVSGELALGYNPNGDGLMKDTNLVRGYTNQDFSYSIIYPTSWIVESIVPDNANIMFTSQPSTGEFVQVIIQDNPSELTAKNWYLNLNPTTNPSLIKTISVNGLEGVRSLDGQTVYLSKADKIYILVYNVGNLETANFRATYEMMLQSFKLTGSS